MTRAQEDVMTFADYAAMSEADRMRAAVGMLAAVAAVQAPAPLGSDLEDRLTVNTPTSTDTMVRRTRHTRGGADYPSDEALERLRAAVGVTRSDAFVLRRRKKVLHWFSLESILAMLGRKSPRLTLKENASFERELKLYIAKKTTTSVKKRRA